MRALRLSFVLLVLALIALPGLQMAFPLINSKQIQENRTLASFPKLQGHDVRSLTKWTAGLSPWFNDNFGFRGDLTRAWNEISIRFGFSERVYIGPDNWLNYRGIVDQTLIDNGRMDEKDVERIGAQFLKLQEYLAAKNVRLLIVSVPQKHHVYPESLPSSAPHRSGTKAFDNLRRFLADQFKEDHIDGKAILSGMKAVGHQAYYKTDFHWTDLAGGEVGRAVTNRIAALEGRPDLAWTDQIPEEPLNNWGGGESRFLPLFTPITENTNIPDVRWNDPSRGTFEPVAGDPPTGDVVNHSFVWRANGQSKRLLPPVVVLDNSYGLAFWRTGMHFNFRKVYHTLLRLDEKGFWPGVLSDLPPDSRYLVLQFHESILLMAADVDWEKVK